MYFYRSRWKTYFGDDVDKLAECVTALENKIFKVEIDLVESFQKIDDDLEQCHFCGTSKGFFQMLTKQLRYCNGWLFIDILRI